MIGELQFSLIKTLANKNFITEEFNSEIEINTDKYRRSSHAGQIYNSEPVKTRPRSHSVFINAFDDFDEESEELEFVGVREEILLIKNQFDKLISVLDIPQIDNINSDLISGKK